MQTIIVAKEFDRITVQPTNGEIIKVEFECKEWKHIFVRRVLGEIICGLSAEILEGANGAARIIHGQGGVRFDPSVPVVYIGGGGICEIIASNIPTVPFSN